MEWMPILMALIVAFALSALLVTVLGWRRPGAAQAESEVVSAIFFFVLLFFATWAAGVWLVPREPMAWGMAWIGWLAVALAVVLLLGSVSRQEDRRRRRNAEPTPATEGELAAVGFGVLFWALLAVLLIAGLVGSLGVRA